MTIDVPLIHTEDFRSEATYTAPAVNVRLVGSAESVDYAPLGKMLGRLHGEAVRLEVREVTIDVRDLEFMNSSCFAAFAAWLGELQGLEPGRQYRIKFLSDEQKHWQRGSLGALTTFATNLIRIET
jgi:hypothetical protein